MAKYSSERFIDNIPIVPTIKIKDVKIGGIYEVDEDGTSFTGYVTCVGTQHVDMHSDDMGGDLSVHVKHLVEFIGMAKPKKRTRSKPPHIQYD